MMQSLPNPKIEKINIIQVRDPFTFRVPSVMEFIEKSFKETMIDDYENLLRNLQKMAINKKAAIFLGQENLQWAGLCIILPANLVVDPQVFHFYSDGSMKFRKKLVKTSLDWIKEQGYNGFWTSNTTDSPDSVFKRFFNKVGKAKKIGTIFRFEV